jgi:hypothetical protein
MNLQKFITSVGHRAVADTFDDVSDYTAPDLGTGQARLIDVARLQLRDPG